MPRIISTGGSSGTTTVSASPGDSIPAGASVFGPFGSAGRLVNTTASPIVLDATDPPTSASLQAQGFTYPADSLDVGSMGFSF